MVEVGEAHPHKGSSVAWRVFFTCWLAYAVFWTPYIVREHFPALTIAEQGSMNVQRYLGWTEDIFQGPREGAYINNNPGASLVGAIPLVLLKPFLARVDRWNQQRPRSMPLNNDGELFWRTKEEGREFYFLLVGFLTAALVMAPATAGTAVYLCSRLSQAGVPQVSAAQAAILYGLATPVLYRTAYLNHNLLVGDAGITALLLLWDPQGRPLAAKRAILAGMLTGFALLCDYSGVVVVVVAALYTWLRSAGLQTEQRWRVLLAYGAGVFPGVAALGIYQAWAFGSLFRPSQHYMTPTAPTSLGYRGFSWPSPALLWANFFDPRFGLFAYCPALLLGLAAPFVTRVAHSVPRRETWILLLYFGLFVLFCAANQYSWLQPLTGFRYLVPVVPALALLALQVAQSFPRLVGWAIAAASLGQSFLMAAAHANSLRASVDALLTRRLVLAWMTRLSEAGVQIGRAAPWVTFGLLGLALALTWLPAIRPDKVLSSAKVNAS
jgi:hypothetical protein